MLDGTYLSRNFATLRPLTWQPPCGFFFGGTLSFVITIISFSFRIISFGTIVRSERIGNPEEESHIFSCLLIISSFSSKHYRKSLLVWTSSWEKSHYLEENPWNENWWLMNALKARTLSIFLQLLAKHKKRKGNIGHYIQEEMKITKKWRNEETIDITFLRSLLSRQLISHNNEGNGSRI